jgi:hypothetical protein
MDIVRTDGDAVQGLIADSLKTLLEDAFGRPPEPSQIELPKATFRLLVTDGGQMVIAHLAAYERNVVIGGHYHSIGMLGGVAVASKHRRQGLCKKLVAIAHDSFREHQVPYSILFACNPNVYRSSGYHLMKNELFFLDEDGHWKTYIFRGSMYCELDDRRWPNQRIDLKGPVV